MNDGNEKQVFEIEEKTMHKLVASNKYFRVVLHYNGDYEKDCADRAMSFLNFHGDVIPKKYVHFLPQITEYGICIKAEMGLTLSLDRFEKLQGEISVIIEQAKALNAFIEEHYPGIFKDIKEFEDMVQEQVEEALKQDYPD